MSLSYIPDADLERMVNTPSQAELQAEWTRRQKQAQDLAEIEHFTALAQTYSERLDQLVGEYQTRYQPLAEALASNPESKLIPELSSLYRLSELIRVETEKFVKASLYSGSLTDPLLVTLRGKPCRGRAEVDQWLTQGILSSQVGNENEKRTGRRELYSFPEPLNELQRELVAAGVLAAKQ